MRTTRLHWAVVISRGVLNAAMSFASRRSRRSNHLSEIGRVRYCILALIAVLLTACGSGLPSSSQISIAITPVQATIPIDATLTLHGTATGFTTPPFVSWWVQESHDLDQIHDCGFVEYKDGSFTSCPFGFVVYTLFEVPSAATYYAPPTPGTYHVTFDVWQRHGFNQVEKSATATIVVTQ